MALRFSPELLLERLAAWPAPGRYVALVSGGGDSSVLLHALAAVGRRLPAPLTVLHFDHGIAPASEQWAQQVAARARALGIPFQCETLSLKPGGAVETRARTARYARLAAWMQPGDGCLSAHHADDQAETFLLQALRGAGPAGLAGMPAWTPFGRGWLGRPLLSWTRAELSAWGSEQGLSWIEDPGNLELDAPRNRLRHRVWPELRAHWPQAARTLARSAELAAEAEALAAGVAQEDLERLRAPDPGRLPAQPLAALPGPRRRNVLRFWLRARGLPLPSARQLAQLEAAFVLADPGSRALLAWPGAEARRYRGALHVMRPCPPLPAGARALEPGRWLDLGALGRVGLMRDPGGPLGEALAAQPLSVRFRQGGERLQPAGAAHHRALKKLLQEREVLPWMRPRLPLLYAGEELAAVAGVAVAAPFSGRGWRLAWEGAPPVQ